MHATRGYVLLLSLLAALWGAGFLFIKVAVRGFEPTTMMLIRLVLAVGFLAAFLAWRGELGALRRAPRGAYALGLANAAIPFTLIALGEKYVDSGTAAVANAGVPLFVALLAPWWAHGERVGGFRFVGLLVGFGGVAWLVGLHHSVSWSFAAGAIAIVAAALAYGVGTLWGQSLASDTSGPVIATAAYIGAAIALLPLGVAQAPHHWPGWKPIAALLVLSLLGTAVAQVIWFRLLVDYGGSRASLVTYLVPGVALVYGSLFLHESLGVSKLGGFALIVLGVVVASAPTRWTLRSREVWRGARKGGLVG